MAVGPEATTRAQRESLWRNGEFVRFWLGETLSLLGPTVIVPAGGAKAIVVGLVIVSFYVSAHPAVGAEDRTGGCRRWPWNHP